MKPVLVLIAFIAANIHSAEAQQPKKVPHIGYVNSSPLTSLERTRAEAFRQGLRDLGYVEREKQVN